MHDTVTMQIWKCSKCRCYRVSLEIKRLKHTVDVEISCFSGVSRMHIDLKSTRGHLMPPPAQHLYNGLVPPCGLFHFCRGMDSPTWGRVESMLAQEWTRDSTLAYGDYGPRPSWLRPAQFALRASRCWHGTDNRTDKMKTWCPSFRHYCRMTKLLHCLLAFL